MSERLTLYMLPPSPNTMKVRIALSYKQIPYDAVEVDLQDRSEVVKVSGQPLVPVILQGDRVLFDSSAILRFLDANFRSTPSLFSTDRDEMRAIEELEQFALGSLSEPVGLLARKLLGRDPNADVSRAAPLMHERTARLEDRLAHSDWLVGNRMTAADVVAAPYVYYSTLSAEAAQAGPIQKAFHEILQLGPGRERTRAWVQRLMAYHR
jgi:glutathione S-transferase